MPAIVWSTCWLWVDDPIYDAFDTLGRELASVDHTLVVFTRAPMRTPRPGFVAIPIAFFPPPETADAGETSPTSCSFDDPATIDEVARLVSLWEADKSIAADRCSSRAAVERWCGDWQAAFDAMQPSAVLSWGTTAPLGHLHRRLAGRRHVAWWALERGPFPETLDMSPGQSAMVGLSTQLALLRTERSVASVDERFEAIRSYYSGTTARHYAGTDVPTADREAALLGGPGKKVLFVGSYDVGSGLAMAAPAAKDGRRSGERTATLVDSSRQAAVAACEASAALAEQGTPITVWLRPHPASPFTLNDAETRGLTTIDVAADDLAWLFAQADVVVGLQSSTHTWGLLWETPQIMLALGPLAGRGAVVEAFSPEALVSALGSALQVAPNSTLQVAQRQAAIRAGREAVVLAFDRHLVGWGQQTPTELTVADMALVISRFYPLGNASGRPVDERIAQGAAHVATRPP